MDIVTLILGIITVLIIAGLDSLVFMTMQRPQEVTSGASSSGGFAGANAITHYLPDHTLTDDTMSSEPFEIVFPDGHKAVAVKAHKASPVVDIIRALGLATPRPAVFISGGAGLMSDDDREQTRKIIEDGIARFAAEYGVTVIDGGTESGVMQMIGQARRNHNYQFPLIGIAPIGKIEYPGISNPDKEADLEDSHSHFVLMESHNWGDESKMLSDLARTIAGVKCATAGILINGGKISQQDVLLATTTGDEKLPILVLEGSGRFADTLATAFRTGQTNQAILKAIIQGADIELVATVEGAEAMYTKLVQRFK